MCNLARLIVVGVLLGGTVAQGGQVRVVRYGDDRLHNITAVDVVIDPLRADAARCGIVREALQADILTALGSAGLEASISDKASSSYYTVYVTASTVISDGHCATSIVTELMAHVEGIPIADRQAAPNQWGSLLVGQLTLIRHNGVVSSRASAHAADVRSVLRDHLVAIGTRVTAANK